MRRWCAHRNAGPGSSGRVCLNVSLCYWYVAEDKLPNPHGAAVTFWITLAPWTSAQPAVHVRPLLSLHWCNQWGADKRQPSSCEPHPHRRATRRPPRIVVFAGRPTHARVHPAGPESFKPTTPAPPSISDFATSAELANQLTRAPAADIFASADSAQIDNRGQDHLTTSIRSTSRPTLGSRHPAPGDPKADPVVADLRQT